MDTEDPAVAAKCIGAKPAPGGGTTRRDDDEGADERPPLAVTATRRATAGDCGNAATARALYINCCGSKGRTGCRYRRLLRLALLPPLLSPLALALVAPLSRGSRCGDATTDDTAAGGGRGDIKGADMGDDAA
jgi:hypothetical protein